MVAVQFRSMRTSLDLYLIATRNKRCVLFSPLDIVEIFEEESDDKVVKLIAWFTRHRNRMIAWVGGVLKKAHEYYVKLEDRIDPGERVLKAMASGQQFVVYHGPPQDSSDASLRFRTLLKRQRIRQLVWFIVDLVFSAIAILFTPILAPIPGPNVVLYFPLLRMLSHYRGIRGANSGLRSSEIEFKCLPDLVGLEENLRTSSFDRREVRAMAQGLKIRGLEQFLERMV
jgi:hypothetical protein